MMERYTYYPPDIIHLHEGTDVHWKHITPEGGSIDVLYHPDALLADSIGQVLAVPIRHLPLLTFDTMFQKPLEKNAEVLYERWKNIPWKGNLEVHIGNVSFMNEMKRTFDGNIKGRPNIFFRLLGLPYTGYKAIVGKLTRDDYYNPLTHTVYTTHPDVAVSMQELGFAQEFDQAKHASVKTATTLIPYVNTYNTYKASEHAMKRFENDEQRRHAMKLYEPILGAQIVRDTSRVITPAMIGTFGFGALMSNYIINNPATYSQIIASGQRVAFEKLFKSTIGAAIGASIILPSENSYAPYMRLLGFLGGHISSRIPNRKEAFGWIFGGHK
jgi:hypothetical protein